MKIKSLAMIGALACGSGSLALAQPQYIYITGSTAMRSIVYHAFADGAGVFDATPNFVGYGSSTASSCSFMNFSNTLGGSTATIVKCHWSGSEAGITDVSGSTQESFLNDPGMGGVAATGPNGATPTGSQLITNGVDLAMADNNLSFSKTPGSSASQTFVGTIPFVFVKGSNTMAAVLNLTNVTDAQFRQTIKVTGQKLALFTGIDTDTNNYVYVAGRNDNSGTRVNTFGITGFGIKTSPKQIELDFTGNMQDQGAPFHFIGDIGQDSGGTLMNTMTNNTATSADMVPGHTTLTGFAVIAYAGLGDANGVTNKGVVKLSYDGVVETPAAVIEGTYGLWGNEYALQRSGASSQAQTVYTKLTDPTTGIPNYCDSVTAFNSTVMHATRGGPTTDSVHK